MDISEVEIGKWYEFRWGLYKSHYARRRVETVQTAFITASDTDGELSCFPVSRLIKVNPSTDPKNDRPWWKFWK